MSNEENLNQPVILKLSDFSSRKVEEVSNESEEHLASLRLDDAKAEMISKIASAKVHGNKEIDLFRKATEEYMGKINGLVLFGGVEGIINKLLIGEMLESTIEPVIQGKSLPGMSEEDYRFYRKQIFKDLIDHYVDGK